MDTEARRERMRPELDEMRDRVNTVQDSNGFLVTVHVASLDWLLAEYERLFTELTGGQE